MCDGSAIRDQSSATISLRIPSRAKLSYYTRWGTYYTAKDTTSGLCIAMGQAPFTTPLTLKACDPSNSSQLLIFAASSNGGYEIETAFRNVGDYQACAEINGGSSASGVMVDENICYNVGNELFSLSVPSGLSTAQAVMADSFVDSIGVNTHYVDQSGSIYGANQALVQKVLNASGIRHIRDGGPASGDTAWMQSYLSLFTQVENNYQSATGRRLGWDLIGGPYDNGSSSGTACDQLTNVSAPYVLKYLNVSFIDSFEGMNEDDIGYYYNTPGCTSSVAQAMQQDVAFQKALYSAVKGSSATSSVPVIGFSFGSPNGPPYVSNMTAYMNFANQHSYPGGKHPSANIASNFSILSAIDGNIQSYATETGYYTYPDGQQGISELAQGKYMSRLFLEYFNFGIVRTYSYELMDSNTSPIPCSGSQPCFGLARGDGSAKPGYTAIQNEISILQDPGPAFTPGTLTYSLSGTNNLIHHTLLNKRNGNFYLVLWQEIDSYNNAKNTDISNPPVTVQLSFNEPMTQVNLYNPLSSSSPFSNQGNVQTLSLSVPDSALIVEIIPASTSSFPPTVPVELVSVNSKMCADVVGGGGAPAYVKQEVCAATSEQLWKFVSMGNGYYEVQPQNFPGMCLDISAESKSAGGLAQQWGCLGASQLNQLWKLVPVGGHYQLVSANSQMCLDVSQVSKTAGAQIWQWGCLGTGQLNQLWDLVY